MGRPVISAIGSRGFTLLELLIALAIIVLIVSAWPFAAARMFPAQQLRNEANRLAGALRSARVASRASGMPSPVEVSNSGYAIAGAPYTLPADIRLAFRTGWTTANSSRFICYPDGSTTGGVFELSLSGRKAQLTIGSVTGAVALLE